MKYLLSAITLCVICFFGADAQAQCADPNVDKCARVTGVIDVNFGVDDFAGNEVIFQSICVYTQADGDGRAQIRNTGGSTVLTADPRRFAMTDGLGNEIRVDVRIRGTVDTALRNIRADQGFTNKVRDVGEYPAETQLCTNGGDTNDIRTRIARAWLNGAVPGVYTGTVELEVRPD